MRSLAGETTARYFISSSFHFLFTHPSFFFFFSFFSWSSRVILFSFFLFKMIISGRRRRDKNENEEYGNFKKRKEQGIVKTKKKWLLCIAFSAFALIPIHIPFIISRGLKIVVIKKQNHSNMRFVGLFFFFTLFALCYTIMDFYSQHKVIRWFHIVSARQFWNLREACSSFMMKRKQIMGYHFNRRWE